MNKNHSKSTVIIKNEYKVNENIIIYYIYYITLYIVLYY